MTSQITSHQQEIAAAMAAGREQLARDLHDSTQQRLVLMGLAVRRAQGAIDAAPSVARAELDGVMAEVTAALAELRDLTRGLTPRRLGGGLKEALEDVTKRLPVAVDLDVDAGCLDPATEKAAFYIACEAITNAVKHAGAARLRVSAAARGDKLVLDVADDGVGGAAPTAGSGLVGLAARTAAHGGHLRVVSPVGHGTTVRAELPCAS